MTYTPRLKEKYNKEVVAELMKKNGYKTVMQCPKILKVSLNQGLGKIAGDKKMIENAVEEMSIIAGQRAVTSKSRKDISNFKLRSGMPVGCRVTLRGNTMYEFLDRLIAVALPRVRDFKGINAKSFDGRGNYTLGVTEQIIFPEIDIDKVSKMNGMDITIVTTAQTDEECKDLLTAIGMPFKKD